MMKLNRFIPAGTIALPLALLGAVPAAVSPATASAGVPQVAAPPSAVGAVDEALAEAAIGNLGPIEELLAGSGITAAERSLLKAQRAAALLQDREAAAAIRHYLQSGDQSAARRLKAHSIAAGSAFAAGHYREASDHAGQYLAAAPREPGHEVEGMQRLKQIADLLAATPRQRLQHSGHGLSAPLVRDKVGLLRTLIRVGGSDEYAVIDTGANMSVASESAARRMGLRMIEGAAAVGNSLGSGVEVRLAIADRLEIAGAVLNNSIFLVMADEALSFPLPGGYRIGSIIGFPALRALGRLRFELADGLRIEAPAPASKEPNLRVLGSDPYAVISVGGRQHPLFFDTGANASSVSLRFVREHPELKTVDAGSTTRAGAGQSMQVQRLRLDDVPVGIGGARSIAQSLNVEASPAPGDEERYGVLGVDLFSRFDTVIIDFTQMRLEALKGD